MIKVRHRGTEIECGTAEEAIAVLKHIDAEERRIRREHLSPVAQMSGENQSPWAQDLFWKFIDDLGEPQKHVLGLLVNNHRVPDQAMREALNLGTNQQLAGVLSGISKQAAAHDLSARDVYTIENESRSGETIKCYVGAPSFVRMAVEMNWPEEWDIKTA